MKKINISVYTFSELSEDAKDRVRYRMSENWGYSWDDDAIASMKALAKYFGGEVSDYSVDFFDTSRSSMMFTMPTWTAQEIRERLKGLGSYNKRTLRGDGDCKLTGICFDEDAIDGFRIAFVRGKERDLEKLMQAAFETWLKSCQSDCAYQFSDEGLAETCEANDYLFLESGEPAPRS